MRSRVTFLGFMIIGVALFQASTAGAQTRDQRGGWARIFPAQGPAPSSAKADEEAAVKEDVARPDVQDISPAAKPTLVGTWLLTVKIPDNAPPFDSFNALWSLGGDGNLVASAQGDVSPVPFPSLTSAYGAWEKNTGKQYAASFVAIFYDFPTGDNLGMLKLNQTITLSDSGDEWSGPFKAKVLDPAGNVVATLMGTAQAKRIKVEH